jgi:very-short-patch-repair endonuclease
MFARHLRRQSTDAERRLWFHLRDGRLAGFKFRRQVPIGPWIVDFAAFRSRLVIELDGGQHLDRARHDAARSRWLERAGFRVTRFWNDDVLRRTDAVLDQILVAIQEADAAASSSRRADAQVESSSAISTRVSFCLAGESVQAAACIGSAKAFPSPPVGEPGHAAACVGLAKVFPSPLVGEGQG